MKLVIDVNEETNQLQLSSDKPVKLDDLMTILFTLQLTSLQNCLKNAPDEQKDEVKNLLYDNYNAGASNVLYLFAPDKELHPDLTVEAMKAAEDRYMYNQLNRKARREVDKKTHGNSKLLRFHNPNHIPHIDSGESITDEGL